MGKWWKGGKTSVLIVKNKLLLFNKTNEKLPSFSFAKWQE